MTRKISEIPQAKKPFQNYTQIKVCAYVRVSTNKTKQLDSLQNQTEYYQRLLNKNPSYKNCGIYSDAGISGAKEARPGFSAMMKKAKAGEIDLIITKSISRFARNILMLLQYVRELRDVGVAIIFEEQNINTLSSQGELMLTVLGAIAEEEQKAVRKNIQWSIQNKYKLGNPMINTNRLLGYDKDKKGNLTINKKQAKIVRLIYKKYLKKDSAYKIANELNIKKVPTYTNKPWSSHRIIRIISNEKYKGDCLMQKNFVAENGKEQINRGQKPQYYIKNNHPAIISQKDWEKAQKIKKKREPKHYPFTKKLSCSYCSANLIRTVHQGRWVSWICATYMRKGKSTCKGSRISEKKLLEITKGIPFTQPMIVEEIKNGESNKKSSQKNFRFIPLTQYNK